MSNILIVSGHPNLSQSVANQAILERLADHYGDKAQIRRLDSLAPDYRFDIEAEQKALLQADVIVLQFPIYWYGAPALLKKWIDDVFTHGFAYSSKGGEKLAGKKLLLSFTMAGPEEEYQSGNQAHTVAQLMYPFEDISTLIATDWQEPVFTYGIFYVPEVSGESDRQNALLLANQHADRLIARLDAL